MAPIVHDAVNPMTMSGPRRTIHGRLLIVMLDHGPTVPIVKVEGVLGTGIGSRSSNE
jgi:hypothetical protein